MWWWWYDNAITKESSQSIDSSSSRKIGPITAFHIYNENNETTFRSTHRDRVGHYPAGSSKYRVRSGVYLLVCIISGWMSWGVWTRQQMKKNVRGKKKRRGPWFDLKITRGKWGGRNMLSRQPIKNNESGLFFVRWMDDELKTRRVATRPSYTTGPCFLSSSIWLRRCGFFSPASMSVTDIPLMSLKPTCTLTIVMMTRTVEPLVIKRIFIPLSCTYIPLSCVCWSCSVVKKCDSTLKIMNEGIK